MASVGRREFIGSLGAAGATAACAPVAPVAAPAGESTGAPWEREWQDLVAAAKKEGKVSVMSLVGAGYGKMVQAFSDAFPGVEGQHEGFPGVTVYEPKIRREREAGVYTFDVGVIPSSVNQREMRESGIFDDLRPVIFRPDATDDSAWTYGYEWGWQDENKVWNYGHTIEFRRPIGINTNLVKDGEIKTLRDLLDPKWKGKMMVGDVRQGGTFLSMTAFRKVIGDDGIKRLIIDQQPTFSLDTRQILESLIRGRYAFVLPGLTPWPLLKDMKDEGLNMSHIRWLDFSEAPYVIANSVVLFNKAPHPNAAKLFINWLLTKEGQTVLSQNIGVNSRRMDVPIADPESALKPGTPGDSLLRMNHHSMFASILDTQKMLEELVRQRG